jgi:hypothetical protein
MTILAYVQAAYFLLTGVWPVMHVRSFLAVTGPKRDLWLVKTVGLLIAVEGAAIGVAAYGRAVTPPVILLAIGGAVVLLAIDVVYVAKRVIGRVYLADALVEAVLIAAWAACLATPRP